MKICDNVVFLLLYLRLVIICRDAPLKGQESRSWTFFWVLMKNTKPNRLTEHQGINTNELVCFYLQFDFQHSRSFESRVLVLWFNSTDGPWLNEHLCLFCRCCRIDNRLVWQSCKKQKENKSITSVVVKIKEFVWDQQITDRVWKWGNLETLSICQPCLVKWFSKHVDTNLLKIDLLRFKPLWFVWLVELCFFRASSAFFWKK